MSKNSKRAQLNTIIFFLAVACLWRYKTDMDEKAKQQSSIAPIVATNNVPKNPYNEIYDKVMAVPEEPKYEENPYDWYVPYEEPRNDLWKYDMPRKEFWEWERDFLDNWRR